jgi:preprotein translocase subunit SecG
MAFMKKILIFACAFFFVAAIAFAAGSKTYQVTGPVMD